MWPIGSALRKVAGIKMQASASFGDVPQWDSSRDYDPSASVERIKAAVLAINSADDERNPPETGIIERELKRIKNARLFLIPASEDTRGHLTTIFAKFWKRQPQEFLQTLPDGAL
jgi:homoserine O-acetyltransferase/O-succinyltransferase